MPRPRVTFSRNGITSSGPSGPPKGTSMTASYGASAWPSWLADASSGIAERSPTGVIFAYEEKVHGCGSCRRARGRFPLIINAHTYRQVLSDRRAVAFSLAGFVARLPLSMTGIGIVLLVSLTTGSFGLAGSLTAAATVTGAVVAPLWGRATDRIGQARVLLLTVLINVVSVTLLVSAMEFGWPLPVCFAAAVGIGIGFSLAGSSVRARWTVRLNGSPLLHTAFAIEAMLDEVVFIIGPVLATFLATTLHPALGVGVSAAIGLI